MWFTTQLPSLGQGRLPDRDVPNLVGKEEEAQLFLPPKDEIFFNNLSVACVRSDVCVDVFAVGAAFVDTASLVQLPSTTGGRLERIAGFTAGNAVHRQSLERAVRRSLSLPRAFAVQLRARTSSGLRVVRYNGHGFPEDGSLRLASWCSDTCLAVEFEHDGTKLEPGKAKAFVQVAALYTTLDGKRRLRSFNVQLPARDTPDVVTAAFDPLSVSLHFAKRVAIALSEQKLADARQGLVHAFVEPIKQVFSRTGGRTGGLVMPENQDLMLLYLTAMLKSPALVMNRPLDRAGMEPFARADARIISRFDWLTFTPDRFAASVYPSLYDITDASTFGDVVPVDPNVVAAAEDPATMVASMVRLPPRLPASSEHLRLDGIYFIHDGSDDLDLFVGSKADPLKVEALVGTPGIRDRVASLSDKRHDAYAVRVVAVARALMGLPPTSTDPVAVHVLGMGEFADARAFAKLVEDKVHAEQSYATFVTQVQQLVLQRVV